MPVLENPRHERFAQAVARGLPPYRAYPAAGYKADDGNPYRLLTGHDRVASRVQELLERSAIEAEFTRTKAIELSLEAAADARAAGQHGAQVGGLRLAADCAGHIVTKSLNINADLNDLAPERLDELLALVRSPLPAVEGSPDVHAIPASGPPAGEGQAQGGEIPDAGDPAT